MIVAIDRFDKRCWLIGNIAARGCIRMKLGFRRGSDSTWVPGQDALAPVVASAWSVLSHRRNGARCRLWTIWKRPDDIRAWFKAMLSPDGASCCDICDRHRTNYEVRAGRY